MRNQYHGLESGGREAVAELHDVLSRFLETRARILEAAAKTLAASVRAGGKILVLGNGGSAAEAQHFVAELVNGLRRRDPAPIAAVGLAADAATLTAIANDRSFAEIFSRQIEAQGHRGDVVIALSTSGSSPDVVQALKAARSIGLSTIALTGEGGGDIAPLADLLLDMPSCSTPRIQEAHLVILHLLAERLEAGGA